ncbi:MAG: hypothetical protein VB915_10555, partial [Pseudomonadales bacterium]
MTLHCRHTWVAWVLVTALGTFATTEENESRTTPVTSAKETASERRERIDIEVQEILNTALDDEDYGKPLRCIWSNRYDKIEMIDERRVIFYGGRKKAWLNHWKHGDQCAGKLYSQY